MPKKEKETLAKRKRSAFRQTSLYQLIIVSLDLEIRLSVSTNGAELRSLA